MKYTTNYNLKKPDLTDVVNIDDLNDNMDSIDSLLADLVNLASLNNNGWFKDKKTGLIIQWGKIGTGINNGIADVQVFFPIAFPNKCTYVGVNAEETSGGGDASLNVTRNLNANAESIGLNAFNIRCKNVVNTYGAQATFRWFSIGY